MELKSRLHFSFGWGRPSALLPSGAKSVFAMDAALSSLPPKAYDMLAASSQRLRLGVDVRDRRCGVRRVANAFTGADALRFLQLEYAAGAPGERARTEPRTPAPARVPAAAPAASAMSAPASPSAAAAARAKPASPAPAPAPATPARSYAQLQAAAALQARAWADSLGSLMLQCGVIARVDDDAGADVTAQRGEASATAVIEDSPLALYRFYVDEDRSQQQVFAAGLASVPPQLLVPASLLASPLAAAAAELAAAARSLSSWRIPSHVACNSGLISLAVTHRLQALELALAQCERDAAALLQRAVPRRGAAVSATSAAAAISAAVAAAQRLCGREQTTLAESQAVLRRLAAQAADMCDGRAGPTPRMLGGSTGGHWVKVAAPVASLDAAVWEWASSAVRTPGRTPLGASPQSENGRALGRTADRTNLRRSAAGMRGQPSPLLGGGPLQPIARLSTTVSSPLPAVLACLLDPLQRAMWDPDAARSTVIEEFKWLAPPPRVDGRYDRASQFPSVAEAVSAASAALADTADIANLAPSGSDSRSGRPRNESPGVWSLLFRSPPRTPPAPRQLEPDGVHGRGRLTALLTTHAVISDYFSADRQIGSERTTAAERPRLEGLAELKTGSAPDRATDASEPSLSPRAKTSSFDTAASSYHTATFASPQGGVLSERQSVQPHEKALPPRIVLRTRALNVSLAPTLGSVLSSVASSLNMLQRDDVMMQLAFPEATLSMPAGSERSNGSGSGSGGGGGGGNGEGLR